MKPLLCLLLFAAFSPSDIHAVNPYISGDTLHVHALSGLRLRDAPNGKVLFIIPYGEKIVMRQAQPNRGALTIEKIKGYWATAEWNGHQGVVFDGFLGQLPAPREKDWLPYFDAHFQLIAQFDSTEQSSDFDLHRRTYQYGKHRISYEDESWFNYLYFTNTDVLFSSLSYEEVYLIFYAIMRNDPEIGSKVTPTQTAYQSDDESSVYSISAEGIRYSWSH
jgi:hypothetical protein